MPYGLDYSDIRFETDHEGNRLKATIPYTMFTSLTQFWIEARKAQTARIEATTRPGQYKGSLPAIPSANPEPEAPPPTPTPARPIPRNASDRTWEKLMAQMPAEPIPAPVAVPVAAPIAEPLAATVESTEPAPAAVERPAKGKPGHVFYREFMAKPPAEVAARIAKGRYFLAAWREHRALTVKDAAELFGRDTTTILYHEGGRHVPTQAILEKFAQIYDVPLLQLVPRPGTDDSPFAPGARRQKAEATKKPEPKVKAKAAPATKKRASPTEPFAPSLTAYPEAVLAHMKAGKSPLLSWRLYRGMSLKELAEQYGGQAGNLKMMEEQLFLRRSTIDKLCPIFHCKPEQLLRPADLVTNADEAPPAASPAESSVSPAPTREASPPAPQVKAASNTAAGNAALRTSLAAAFEQAQTVDPLPREARTRTRAQASRLDKMQRELSRI